MAKRRNTANTISPAARLAVLGSIVGIFGLFAAVAFGTAELMDTSPFLLIPVLVLGSTVYTVITSNLLHKYFEVRAPFIRFIPCYGELTLMDNKFLKIGTIFYGIAIVALLCTRIPFNIARVVSEDFAFSLPFYCMVVALIALLAVQIIKGIGLLGCVKIIVAEWNEHVGGSIGIIKSLAWLGFLPFVRVVAMYALNKPLSTMVTFNSITVSADESVELEEEDEEVDTSTF